MTISLGWLLPVIHLTIAAWAVFTYIEAIIVDLRNGTKKVTFREFALDVMAVVWMIVAWEIMLGLYIYFSLTQTRRAHDAD